MSWSHLFLLVVIQTLSFTSLSQSTPHAISEHPIILEAYNDILKLKLEIGRQKLRRIIPSQDQIGHIQFINSLADVVEIIISEDKKLLRNFEGREDDYLKKLREMDNNDPHKRFYEAEIKIQWAIVKIMFDDHLKAGWSLKSAYGTIEDNVEQFPDFDANYKSFGTLRVLFGAVPETYHWVLRLYGIRGNTIKGWDELNKIDDQSPYWLETGLIKTLIAVNIINREDLTTTILNKLLSHQPDNLAVNYLHNIALMKYAKSDEALPNLKRLIYTGNEYYRIDNIHYKLGTIYLQNQEYPLARYHLSKFLNLYKGYNYIKDSWFKVFLSYWLEGNEKLAEIHWTKAQKTGNTFTAADKNANAFLLENEYPSKLLMSARLAIDGGYFELAHRILDSTQQGLLQNKEEESEYFYRYGRLFDKTNEKEKAIYHYLNAIKKAGNENWYFAPSACLYTGYIYEERGDLEKANYYYRKALTYKKHQYKTGIDQKAKAAIALLR